MYNEFRYSTFYLNLEAVMDNNQFNPDEMKKKFEASSKDPKNLAVYIATAAVIVSVFLPFLKMNFLGVSESISLMEAGKGIFYIVLALGIAASRLFGKMILQLITNALLLLLFLYDFFGFTSSEFGEMLKHGIGAYLLLIAMTTITTVTVILFLKWRKK